ncbi:MAG: DUF2892 domain-containing protein [Promethearchaeota archaeon]
MHVEEIYIINEAGLPIFYYKKDELTKEDSRKEDYTLRACIFNAINHFVSDLEDTLKYIVLEKRSYYLSENKSLLIIFGAKGKPDPAKVEQEMTSVSTYVQQLLSETKVNTSIVNLQKIGKVFNNLNNYLVQEHIIEGDIKTDEIETKEKIQNLIFKTVGYEPGKCNIGSKERLQRLILGLSSIVLSFVGFIAILYFSLPQWIRLVLSIPLFFGFLGIYQYFFRFCVKNALTRKYEVTGGYNGTGGRKPTGTTFSGRVEDSEMIKQDYKKATLILALSLVSALMINLFLYFWNF